VYNQKRNILIRGYLGLIGPLPCHQKRICHPHQFNCIINVILSLLSHVQLLPSLSWLDANAITSHGGHFQLLTYVSIFCRCCAIGNWLHHLLCCSDHLGHDIYCWRRAIIWTSVEWSSDVQCRRQAWHHWIHGMSLGCPHFDWTCSNQAWNDLFYGSS